MSAFEGLTVLAAQVSAEAERLSEVFQAPDVAGHFARAAEAFVDEAERRGGLQLDLLEGFKGMVLEAAIRRHGADKEAMKKAFLLLGKANIVKGRNHIAQYERERDKLQELRRALPAAAAAPTPVTPQ